MSLQFFPSLFQTNESSAKDYLGSHNPSTGLDFASVNELAFEQTRQSWIDGCTGSVKSSGIFHNRTTAANNCGALYDANPKVQAINNKLAQKAEAEKAQVQADTSKNIKIILGIIGTVMLLVLLIYLFKSKANG